MHLNQPLVSLDLIFLSLLFRFLCCNLVGIGLGFCTSQLDGWEDHIGDDLYCVEMDVNSFCN